MKIYQLTNTTAYQMMGYVIKTSDERVIVIDGGHRGQSEELYKNLKEVGLTVDLWILTHLHCDHFEAIIELFENHHDITVKEFWRNRNDKSLEFMSDAALNEVNKWYEFEKTIDIKLHSPEVDEKISIGTADVEVLGVANPEITTNILNNQSMAIKVCESDFSIIFLGDLGIEGGRKLVKLQKNKLSTDAVQMSHHGQQGVEKEVYEIIAPKYAFWPTPKWLWDNTEYLGGTPGNGSFQTPEDIGWMEELSVINITSFDKTVIFDTETRGII